MGSPGSHRTVAKARSTSSHPARRCWRSLRGKAARRRLAVGEVLAGSMTCSGGACGSNTPGVLQGIVPFVCALGHQATRRTRDRASHCGQASPAHENAALCTPSHGRLPISELCFSGYEREEAMIDNKRELRALMLAVLGARQRARKLQVEQQEAEEIQ